MTKLKNIPNILSTIRILLVGAFIYAFYCDYPNNLKYALIIFLSAGLSDVIDGFLARKFNWITNLGKILDPFADKLMQCTVLVCMLTKKLIPAWLVIPFICKEFLMLLGGLLIIKKRRFVVVSNVYGKMTVVLFYAAVALCITARDYLAQHPLSLYAICILVLVAAISALINYATKYIKALKIIPEENTVDDDGVTDMG
jgi:cardiolipin synthase